jgi:hypothetical protein
MFSFQFLALLMRSIAFVQQLGFMSVSGMKLNQWKMLPCPMMSQIGAVKLGIPMQN